MDGTKSNDPGKPSFIPTKDLLSMAPSFITPMKNTRSLKEVDKARGQQNSLEK